MEISIGEMLMETVMETLIGDKEMDHKMVIKTGEMPTGMEMVTPTMVSITEH